MPNKQALAVGDYVHVQGSHPAKVLWEIKEVNERDGTYKVQRVGPQRPYRDVLFDEVALATGEPSQLERFRTALERIEAMAVRPRCACGQLTGTAAIKEVARKALG